jgi:hypothetical protein
MADGFLSDVEGLSDLTQKADQVLSPELLLDNTLVFKLHLLPHNTKIMGHLGVSSSKLVVELLQRCILTIILFEPCVLFI